MASNAKTAIVKHLPSARIPIPVWKKYTVQSTGVWERIRRALAVGPERSTGIPLNAQFRNPPPGANPPQGYDDPVTVPAGDIADNPYYKRDMRRNYPRLSMVKQADVVQLLLAGGSKASPKDDAVQQIEGGGGRGGEDKGAGKGEVVLTQGQGEGEREGKEKGLSTLLISRNKENLSLDGSIFGPDGLPPFPTGMNSRSSSGGRQYVLDTERAEGYPEEYPCRTFA